MNRHKKQRLSTRNWEVLDEFDEAALPVFEKVRRNMHDDEMGMDPKHKKQRQNFHRPRLG
ncbi:MAG: hypothetical protein P8Y61_04230 [Gammaproteobacteria bacterium]|jgi:hypothetical protein